jgi:hypothetical protein
MKTAAAFIMVRSQAGSYSGIVVQWLYARTNEGSGFVFQKVAMVDDLKGVIDGKATSKVAFVIHGI